MTEQMETTKDVALETIITNAVKVPMVKVSRDGFLRRSFPRVKFLLRKFWNKDPWLLEFQGNSFSA
mgnify:CR=1 FL=1